MIERHPDGTGHPHLAEDRRVYSRRVIAATDDGTLTWKDLLKERAYAVMAASGPEDLDSQLFALITTCQRWRIDLADRRAPT